MSQQGTIPVAPSATTSILGLDQALGVDINSLVRAFRNAGDGRSEAALVDLDLVDSAVFVLREYAVAQLRRSGASWERIGSALGCSRQSAHEKFRYLDPPAIARR